MHIDGIMRPVLSRSTSLRGPRFYRSGEDRAVILFVNQLDSSTREGPREALETDAQVHPKAYADFLEGDAAEQAARPHSDGVVLDDWPTPRLLSARDPVGGRPPRETGTHESRRAAARERGEVA